MLESRFEARQGDRVARMVGRDQELALLLERWRQAKAGEGQLVLLTGRVCPIVCVSARRSEDWGTPHVPVGRLNRRE